MDKTLAIFLSLSVFSVFGAETFGHGPLSSKLTGGLFPKPFISNDSKGSFSIYSIPLSLFTGNSPKVKRSYSRDVMGMMGSDGYLYVKFTR